MRVLFQKIIMMVVLLGVGFDSQPLPSSSHPTSSVVIPDNWLDLPMLPTDREPDEVYETRRMFRWNMSRVNPRRAAEILRAFYQDRTFQADASYTSWFAHWKRCDQDNLDTLAHHLYELCPIEPAEYIWLLRKLETRRGCTRGLADTAARRARADYLDRSCCSNLTCIHKAEQLWQRMQGNNPKSPRLTEPSLENPTLLLRILSGQIQPRTFRRGMELGVGGGP